MGVISVEFAGFVALSVIMYHLLPWKNKHIWLLAISYIFYILLDIRYATVLLLLTGANYICAKKWQTSGKNNNFPRAAIILNLISFSLIKLFSSKYLENTFLFPSGMEGYWLLPVGFSFYVLQLISFQLALNKNTILTIPMSEEFFLCFAYFPKLLSGPIEKPVQFLQKLNNPSIVTNEIIGKAIGLIFNGLFRKLVIAGTLTALVPLTFQNEGGANQSW